MAVFTSTAAPLCTGFFLLLYFATSNLTAYCDIFVCVEKIAEPTNATVALRLLFAYEDVWQYVWYLLETRLDNNQYFYLSNFK